MKFEWDDNKEQINIRKHNIKFSTAAMVFKDEFRLEFYDERHSTYYEDRYLTIGLIDDIAVIVVVVYTERCEYIRIISARRANSHERRLYYDSSARY